MMPGIIKPKSEEIKVKKCLDELERNLYELMAESCMVPKLSSFRIETWRGLDEEGKPHPHLKMEFSYRTEINELWVGSPRVKGGMGLNPWPKPCGNGYSLWEMFNRNLRDVIEICEKRREKGDEKK